MQMNCLVDRCKGTVYSIDANELFSRSMRMNCLVDRCEWIVSRFSLACVCETRWYMCGVTTMTYLLYEYVHSFDVALSTTC